MESIYNPDTDKFETQCKVNQNKMQSTVFIDSVAKFGN